MTDQATVLRRIRGRRENSGVPAIVVGSGKGGVGKSVISAMLALRLARRGRRVLLVDGDQNLGNLHVLLGVRPSARLGELVEGDVSPEQLVQEVLPDLWLVPADSGADSVQGLGPADRARLHHQLAGLYDDYDAAVIDAGAGLDSVVRTATMHATGLVVVTLAEPAALTDAYALIKIVDAQVPALPVHVLLNRVHEPEEGRDAFDRLAVAAGRFLQRDLNYIGAIPEDPAVAAAVRDPQRLVAGSADHPAGHALDAALDRIPLPPKLRVVRPEMMEAC